MNPFRFTDILFDFIHLPVSHFSNTALPFRERLTRVPSVIKLHDKNLELDKLYLAIIHYSDLDQE